MSKEKTKTPKRLLKLLQDGKVENFYWSKEWKSKRKEILIRDNKECQHCKSKGKATVTSLEVHHIKHLKDYPLLALTDSNLITLCTACHNLEHPEKFKEQNKSNIKINIPERW